MRVTAFVQLVRADMTVMMRARLGAASVRAGVPGRSTTRPTQLLYTRLYAR